MSKSAASKVLNGRAGVSEQTRQRVTEVSQSLGYTRASLPSDRALPLIALVSGDLTSSYSTAVVCGATQAATHAGVVLATSPTGDEPTGEHPAPPSEEWLTLLAQSGFLGVIVVAAALTRSQQDAADRLGLPVITIDPTESPAPGSVSIGATNWNGGLDATTHLIGLGHHRIAFIGGPTESVPSMERHQGYLSALAMHGIAVDRSLVSFGGFSYETGLTEGRRLLALPEGVRPTAVFAASDTTAIGVFEAAREHGLSIPTDLSVVGFDDCDIASWTTPRLTSVHQPLAVMGGEAVRMILAHAGGHAVQTAAPVRLTTSLTTRDSTAAPAS